MSTAAPEERCWLSSVRPKHTAVCHLFSLSLKSLRTPSVIHKSSRCSTQTKRLAQQKAEAPHRSKSETPSTAQKTQSLPALCNTTELLNFRGFKLTGPGKSWMELRAGTGAVWWGNIEFVDRLRTEPEDSPDRAETSSSSAARQLQDSGLRTQGSGLRAQDSGLRAQGSGLRTQDSGLRTQGSGLRAQGSEGGKPQGEGGPDLRKPFWPRVNAKENP